MGDNLTGAGPMNSDEESSPQLNWLSAPERRLAVRAYERWCVRLLADGRLPRPSRERIALQSAYGTVACAWMLVWVPLTMAAAFSFEIDRAAQVAFAVAAVLPAGVCFFRVYQAWRAFPELYRLPRQSGHAD